MPRGRKTGVTKEGSFTSKLLQIKNGETVMFEDEFTDGCGDPIKGASRLERAVHSAMSREPALVGRRFHTTRAVAVFMGMKGTMQVLSVMRIDYPEDQQNKD